MRAPAQALLAPAVSPTAATVSESQSVKLSIENPAAVPSPRAEATTAAAPVPTSTAVPTPEPPKPIYPIAVVVENSWDARPQSGLAQADVLYEAPVEGAISRFMAVFANSVADNIGPVRSARHYFVYLAAEYNASLVHVGSSPQGYGALNATDLVDLDETYGDPGFWRIKGRYAPHNAYTNVDVIKDALDRTRKPDPGGLAGFKFRGDDKPLEGKSAPVVYVDYSGGDSLKYVYSPERKAYLRYMDGVAHKDADTGEQIAPRNLVVQTVDAWVIDDVGRLDMDLVGEGKALFFRDGVATRGSWRKSSYGSVTEWLDSDGNPVLMNPGKIFVQIVTNWDSVEY